MTAEAALRRKGLQYEKVELAPGPHNEEMERIYGAGNRTVPGLLVDDEPVHGSRPILARLEEMVPEPPLYPGPIAAEVREAERWGDVELQDLGRRLPWAPLISGPRRWEPTAAASRSTRRHRLRDRHVADVVEVPPDHRPAAGGRPGGPAGEDRPRRRRSPARGSSVAMRRQPPTCRSARRYGFS